jgi:CRISPR type III-A-associated RAMP protein Csm4
MSAALLVRFRPAGPWRLGPGDGARDRVDRLLHSDSLFSALTIAMRELGWIDEWIPAAISGAPAVRLSSCYPYTDRTLLVQPPRSLWPPPQTGKVRWKAARFVPAPLIAALLSGYEPDDEQWAVDPVSGCLLPIERNAPSQPPFRVSKRVTAAVDRVTGASLEPQPVACLEFTKNSGMWFVAVFRDDETRRVWADRIRAASRLLADTGIGGERSAGWGRSEAPAFEDVEFPSFLTGDAGSEGGERAWWLLSLYAPAGGDQVDFSRGNYEVLRRTGRIETRARWGALKSPTKMVAEGSVLLSAIEPVGAAPQVGNGDIPHPVYRCGFAVAAPIAWHESQRLSWLAKERAPQPAPPSAPPAEPEPEPAPAEFEYEPEPSPVSEPEPETAELPAEADTLAVPEPPAPPAEPPPASSEPPAEEPPSPEPSPVAEPEAAELPAEADTFAISEAPAPPVEPAPPSEPPVQEPPPPEPPPTEPPVREPDPEPPPIKAPEEPAGESADEDKQP